MAVPEGEREPPPSLSRWVWPRWGMRWMPPLRESREYGVGAADLFQTLERVVASLGWPVIASDPATRTMTFTMRPRRAYASADANARVVRLDAHAARVDVAATHRFSGGSSS